ncbi:calcium:proton antiporter [Microbacterium gorillae]|uniref:calcium:proton antiporter n=1 Tax=Microbacterium gorillae TaxID=1231063 RepID=UPI003D98DCB5
MTVSQIRRILSPAALFRLVLPWAAVVATALLPHELPLPAVWLVLGAIVAVILVAAFGVVHEAEALAHRLGDPYGTLVLTLSIVLIEVILISAVMLGPGEHATIARDSVTAVMMIILNLVVGVCLLVGGLRHGAMRPNRSGSSVYVAMIAVLSATAMIIPAALPGGAYPAAAAVAVSVITIVLYGFFLWRQTGVQADDYREVGEVAQTQRAPLADTVRDHGRELAVRTALLVATMVPIVLLSHHLATLLDVAFDAIGAPTALAGVVIALIVFTPETITAVRAARTGEIQRVVNLCLGAFVSTVGLTIPSVLVIGLVTGQSVVLAESPIMLVLVAATIVTTAVTFLGKRVTATHGAVHAALFALFAVLLFL